MAARRRRDRLARRGQRRATGRAAGGAGSGPRRLRRGTRSGTDPGASGARSEPARAAGGPPEPWRRRCGCRSTRRSVAAPMVPAGAGPCGRTGAQGGAPRTGASSEPARGQGKRVGWAGRAVERRRRGGLPHAPIGPIPGPTVEPSSPGRLVTNRESLGRGAPRGGGGMAGPGRGAPNGAEGGAGRVAAGSSGGRDSVTGEVGVDAGADGRDGRRGRRPRFGRDRGTRRSLTGGRRWSPAGASRRSSTAIGASGVRSRNVRSVTGARAAGAARRRLGISAGSSGVARQPVAVSLSADAIGLGVLDARGVTLHSDPEAYREVERLLVREPEFACELVNADLLRQVLRSSLLCGARGPRMLDAAYSLSSHVLELSHEALLWLPSRPGARKARPECLPAGRLIETGPPDWYRSMKPR